MSVIIDCEFPGGNVVVDGIDGDTVRLRQDLRDTEGDWFYWCFRVRGAEGRTLTFRFTRGDVIGVRGPAVGEEEGRRWRWLGREVVDGPSFRTTFGEAAETRFCFAFPYLEQDLQAFVARHAGSPYLEAGELCRTRKGRPVELLRLGRLDGGCDHRVLLVCRHHCCESMASYSLEGLMEAVLAGDDEGRWLAEHVEFLVVPFVDKDGVEDGDQGKNRRPHDHNRDYGPAASIYASVRALRRLAPEWSAGRLRVALDLHCPWIRGEHNEVIYFVGDPDQEHWERVGRFSAVLAEAAEGPLPFDPRDDLPFGAGWNTEENYGEAVTFGTWAAGLEGVLVGSCIEIPYANVKGRAVTAETARAFGRDLACALRRYLADQ